MRDLTKARGCEGVSDADWELEKNRRILELSALPCGSNQEKAIHRQVTDNVNTRNAVEELLRTLAPCKTSPNQGQDVYFNDTIKDKCVKILRAKHADLVDQRAYLDMAKEVSYEAADEFKCSRETECGLDDEAKKKYEEIKRKHTPRANKASGTGYKFKKAFKPYQYGGNWGPVGSYYAPGGYAMVNAPMIPNQMGMGMMGMMNNNARPALPRFPRNHPKPIDKTNSTCKACNGIGHWAGDHDCPLTMAAFNMGHGAGAGGQGSG